VYEVVNFTFLNNIFGQVEYEVGYKILGKAARIDEFDPETFAQNPIKDDTRPYEERDVEVTFVQQRGLPEVEVIGETGDSRELRERLGDDMPEIALGEGPRKVAIEKKTKKASKFYSDD